MQFPLYDAMLIGTEQPPFDDDAYIYEIKMDGVRCLAYLYKDHVELINKRHLKLNSKFPELKSLYKQAKKPCVIDGELHVFQDTNLPSTRTSMQSSISLVSFHFGNICARISLSKTYPE